MKTYSELVLEELQRDSTPRTAAQIEVAVAASTGIERNKSAIHSAITSLRARPDVKIVTSGITPRKYCVATPDAPAKTQAEISAEFERNLWAVRQGRGQA